MRAHLKDNRHAKEQFTRARTHTHTHTQGGDIFEVKLTYNAPDATRLSLSGTVTPANRTAVGAMPYTRGLYDVTYHVTISGTYTMQVMRYGKNVKNSPTSIVINSGVVDPGSTTASGFGHIGGVYYSRAEAAKTLTFTVTARDRFGNVVQQPSILNELELSVMPAGASTAINPFPTPGLAYICMHACMYACTPA